MNNTWLFHLFVQCSIYNHIQELLLRLSHVAHRSDSQYGSRRQRDKYPVSVWQILSHYFQKTQAIQFLLKPRAYKNLLDLLVWSHLVCSLFKVCLCFSPFFCCAQSIIGELLLPQKKKNKHQHSFQLVKLIFLTMYILEKFFLTAKGFFIKTFTKSYELNLE